MSTALVSFKAVSVLSTRKGGENATRETKLQRDARAAQMFGKAEKGLVYLGVLPLDARKALADGKTIEVEGKAVSAAQPGILRCAICSGVHGQESGMKDVKLTGMITLYKNVKTGDIFSLSATCRKDYLGIHVTKALSNPEVYRTEFPK